VATVLVLRGTLAISDTLVAGTARCRVRQIVSSSGAALTSALPGQPVEVIGWKELPAAGDEVLQSVSEEEARKAIEARLRRKEQATLMVDVEAINAKRLEEAEQAAIQAQKEAATPRNGKKGPAPAPIPTAPEGPRELLLIVKADVSGSEEAVVESLDGIGNKDAVAKVISSGVGDVTESDVNKAKALGGASSPT
jgi:translation initiation factor IF-2